jgi:digeranylgeranylglycerophospholipid reductase
VGPESMRVECDILVVGLGPAGAAAALEASRAGCDVIAADRKAVLGEPVQCAELVPLPISHLASENAVRVQRVCGMRTHLPSGAIHDWTTGGLMVDRAAFDRALAESARAAGATLWPESRLTRLDYRAREADIRTPVGETTVAWKVLVGADGPHSPVASSLGLAPLVAAQTRQYTVTLREGTQRTEIWLSGRYPGGYAWLFPKGGTANLGLGLDIRDIRRLKPLLDALHMELCDDGRVGREVAGRTGGAIPVGGMRPRLVHDRVLFVGDAGGMTHPVTGAGIAPAVISGRSAGRAAAAFLAGRPKALAEYEEDMRDRFGASYARAVQRRKALGGTEKTGGRGTDRDYRRAWTAFPEYFA